MASASYKLFGNQNPYASQSTTSLRPYSSPAPVSGLSSTFAPASRAVGLLENQPGQLQPLIKSGAQQDRIGQLYDTYDKNKLSDTNSLADFTKNYLAGDAPAKAATAEETAAIGGYYNGGIGSQLDRLSAHAASAGDAAARRAIGEAGRRSALYRMANGNSSYADAQMADQYSGIALQNAQRDAAQRLLNYQTVLQGQQNNLGVRNKLQDAYLSRMLLPGQNAHNLFMQQMGDLGTLGNLDAANTSYSAPTYSPYTPPPAPTRAPIQSAADLYWAAHKGAPSLAIPGSTTYGLPKNYGPILQPYLPYQLPLS